MRDPSAALMGELIEFLARQETAASQQHHQLRSKIESLCDDDELTSTAVLAELVNEERDLVSRRRTLLRTIEQLRAKDALT